VRYLIVCLVFVCLIAVSRRNPRPKPIIAQSQLERPEYRGDLIQPGSPEIKIRAQEAQILELYARIEAIEARESQRNQP
jgi:hypothetical protein